MVRNGLAGTDKHATPAARLAASVIVALLSSMLAACASSALTYSGLVTAAPQDLQRRDAPTRRVALQDRVTVVTNVASLDGGDRGGRHAVRWHWYEGDTLIAEQNKTLEFGRVPYRFSRTLAAADLGVGHYRVEVLVDDKRVDEQVFDVVGN